MRAYDLEKLPHPADRSGTGCQGWCFGLPPGITTERWPLDPRHGYPLKHGFTLLLPEDYRVHGPELVALSFFATAEDHNVGGIFAVEDWPEVVQAASPEPPADANRLQFWQAARSVRPKLSRMDDILGHGYAVILLAQAELDGPFCTPPRWAGNALLDREAPPRWLVCGFGPDGYEDGNSYWSAVTIHQRFSELPPPSFNAMADNRALRWTPRLHDPNAGIPPRDEWD